MACYVFIKVILKFFAHPREYIDLKRNQELLRELVIRRGLPVLDNIRSGLQRTQQILAGTSERQTPFKIASRLM